MVKSLTKKNKLAFFSGNRAEFGILYPLIRTCAQRYQVDLYISGTHTMKEWNTKEEILSKLKDITVNLIEIPIKTKSYELSLSEIYEKSYSKINKQLQKYDLSICLGDRIETLAFALASYFQKIPIVHIAAGDVENSPYFDANLRHSISKISSIFFVTNEKSKQFLVQLGEEKWRIFNTGHFSLCYDKIGLIKDEKVLSKKFNINKNDIVLLLTYHPSHIKNQNENLNDVKEIYNALRKLLEREEKVKIIWTYPNNDPNYDKMFEFIKNLKNNKNIIVVNTLGTDVILSLFKYFNVIVVGNSSLGLTETAFYGIPAINIGDRQIDRFRGDNVIDVEVNKEKIFSIVLEIVKNYKMFKEKFLKSPNKYFFGDGTGCEKAIQYLDQILKLPKEKLLFKKTILRL